MDILKDYTFSAAFTISNPGKYKINYYLFINENKEAAIKEDCSEEKEYTFDDFVLPGEYDGDKKIIGVVN